MLTVWAGTDRPTIDRPSCGGFFFFIFKKNKISKIYLRFGKFQKYIPVALWGRQGSNVIFFFFKFATKSLEEKKRGPVTPPPMGDRPLSPTQGATDQWAQPTGARGAGRPSRGRQGGLSPPPGDRVNPPYIMPPSHSLLIWPQKIHQKSRKKRGVRRREAAKLCRIPHLWSTGNFRINALILYNNLI